MRLALLGALLVTPLKGVTAADPGSIADLDPPLMPQLWEPMPPEMRSGIGEVVVIAVEGGLRLPSYVLGIGWRDGKVRWSYRV